MGLTGLEGRVGLLTMTGVLGLTVVVVRRVVVVVVLVEVVVVVVGTRWVV